MIGEPRLACPPQMRSCACSTVLPVDAATRKLQNKSASKRDLMTTTLDHARRLLALAQSGLHFTHEEYDRERYREIVTIATAMLANESAHSAQKLHDTWF